MNNLLLMQLSKNYIKEIVNHLTITAKFDNDGFICLLSNVKFPYLLVVTSKPCFVVMFWQIYGKTMDKLH